MHLAKHTAQRNLESSISPLTVLACTNERVRRAGAELLSSGDEERSELNRQSSRSTEHLPACVGRWTDRLSWGRCATMPLTGAHPCVCGISGSLWDLRVTLWGLWGAVCFYGVSGSLWARQLCPTVGCGPGAVLEMSWYPASRCPAVQTSAHGPAVLRAAVLPGDR